MSKGKTTLRRFKIAPESGGPSWDVEWYEQIDSTMSRAAELAASNPYTRTVVVADFQRAGRGTHGRIWTAPSGTCLMFSLPLRPVRDLADLETLPARIAVEMRDRLRAEYGVPVSVKHPNDLMVGDQKLAGVLCQSHIQSGRVEWLICGIGLNTNLSSDEIVIPGSTSMRIESGQHVDHFSLLKCLLHVFDRLERDSDRSVHPCPR